jgi:hypothetical protein
MAAGSLELMSGSAWRANKPKSATQYRPFPRDLGSDLGSQLNLCLTNISAISLETIATFQPSN